MFSFFKNKPLSIIDPATNIYHEEYCSQRIAEERLRAERSNAPFSLIIIESTPSFKNNGAGRNHLQTFAERLHSITRKTDIKGWYQNDKIAVLMPYTSKEGGLKLSEKLAREISKISDTTIDISFMFYTYGEESPSDASSYTPVSLYMLDKKSKTKQCFMKMSWERDLSHNNTIALPHSLLNEFFEFSRGIINRSFQLKVKRALDITGSSIAIITLFPIMILLSILIKATSPGPVLFKQERLGYRGKKFTFLKFRSMTQGSGDASHKNHALNLLDQDNADDKPWAKLSNDARITSVGKFLRKGSMDELPQLFNVLMGDMSLVGPRPPIAYEVEKYQLWHLKRILDVKPGITGFWQTHGRGAATFNDMVRLDITYVNNWSLTMDLKILLKTVAVVLSTKGAK